MNLSSALKEVSISLWDAQCDAAKKHAPLTVQNILDLFPRKMECGFNAIFTETKIIEYSRSENRYLPDWIWKFQPKRECCNFNLHARVMLMKVNTNGDVTYENPDGRRPRWGNYDVGNSKIVWFYLNYSQNPADIHLLTGQKFSVNNINEWGCSFSLSDNINEANMKDFKAIAHNLRPLDKLVEEIISLQFGGAKNDFTGHCKVHLKDLATRDVF